jgi:hypothetical protein
VIWEGERGSDRAKWFSTAMHYAQEKTTAGRLHES